MAARIAKVPFMAGGKSYALWFKHKDLRDVVARTGKSLGELATDFAYGWSELIQVGLRWQHKNITSDDACTVIDDILGDGNDLKFIETKLTEALTASGYFKREDREVPEDEGNAQSPNTPLP